MFDPFDQLKMINFNVEKKENSSNQVITNPRFHILHLTEQYIDVRYNFTYVE